LNVGSVNVRQAQAQYLPSLSLNTGVGGYTYQNTNPNFLIEQQRAQGLRASAQCGLTNQVLDSVGLGANKQNCSAFLLTPADEAAIRAQNSVFPFDFTRQPRSITATISLPLFDNFAREQRIQEAQATRNDARIRVRARELELTQGVTAAFLTMKTAQQTVALQEQNVAKAAEELRLTEERYRVGAGTFLDVTTSRGEYERALTDRINAIYDYHRAFAALESAVGRPLR
jgi:outer membrane protein